jgi:FkbM family methyltransferase
MRLGLSELLHPAPPPDQRPSPPEPSLRGVALSDGRVLTHHPVASHMIADGHCLLVTPAILFGTYERGVTRFLRDAVLPGDIVIDVGANQGFHTLTLGMGVHPSGHVWAFEPHPRSCRVLEDNVATTFLHHVVTVVEAAVWSTDGELTFRARDGESAGSYLREAFTIPGDRAAGEDLQMRTVGFGPFLAGLPRPPALVKLDAEGSEPTILRSAADVLREHHPTVLLEVLRSTFDADTDEEIDAWETWLRDLGYHIAFLDDMGTATPVPPGSFRTLRHGAEVVLYTPGGRGSPRDLFLEQTNGVSPV